MLKNHNTFYSLLIIISFLVVPISFAQNNDDKCFCKFDTDQYKAKCDCALACAVAIKEGKYCNIVCDGSTKSAIKDDKYFKGKEKYLADMFNIRKVLFKDEFEPFHDFDFSEWALPRLIRSAYIGAEFIEDNKKVELDKLIVYVFNNFNKEIVYSFSGEHKDGFKIDLSAKYNRKIIFKTSLKSIKLIYSSYDVKFIYLK